MAQNETRCEGSYVVLGGDVAIWSVKVGCVWWIVDHVQRSQTCAGSLAIVTFNVGCDTSYGVWTFDTCSWGLVYLC